MYKIPALLFVLVFSACSGHIQVIPRGCYGDNPNRQWVHDFDPDYKADFKIRKRVWNAGFGTENSTKSEVFLKSFLGKHNVKCVDIESLKVSINQSSKDVLLSIIPFISRHTVTVEGQFKKDKF